MTSTISEADLQDLCDHITKIDGSLLHAFHDATPDQHSRLESKLHDLQRTFTLYEILYAFRKAIKEAQELVKKWVPKGLIEQVLQACYNERYKEDDIEYIFYKHGEANALLVLHWGTKSQNALFGKIYTLPKELRISLAKKCKNEEISPFVSRWINCDTRSKTQFNPIQDPPRLDRWAKDKESRLSSPSASRKRIRSDALTPHAAIQRSSMNPEIPQYLPPLENIPLHYDSQPSNIMLITRRELPPPAAPQRQQHSSALNDAASHFDSNLSIVDMATMQPVPGEVSALTGSNLQFIGEPESWDWTSELDLFNPNN